MGRRKIQIAPIADDRNRSVTFVKRKNGLMKRAYELGVLCNAEVAVIVFASNGKLYQYSSGDLDATLKRHARFDGPPYEHRRPADFEAPAGFRSKSSQVAAGPSADDDDDDDDDDGGLDDSEVQDNSSSFLGPQGRAGSSSDRSPLPGSDIVHRGPSSWNYIPTTTPVFSSDYSESLPIRQPYMGLGSGPTSFPFTSTPSQPANPSFYGSHYQSLPQRESSPLSTSTSRPYQAPIFQDTSANRSLPSQSYTNPQGRPPPHSATVSNSDPYWLTATSSFSQSTENPLVPSPNLRNDPSSVSSPRNPPVSNLYLPPPVPSDGGLKSPDLGGSNKEDNTQQAQRRTSIPSKLSIPSLHAFSTHSLQGSSQSGGYPRNLYSVNEVISGSRDFRHMYPPGFESRAPPTSLHQPHEKPTSAPDDSSGDSHIKREAENH